MAETHDKRTETHACDLISRQAAIKALYSVDEYNARSVKAIKELPPVQPKRGKWLDANICGELPVIVCDQCNTFYPLSFGDFHNFCPHCGAKMDGKDGEGRE